jgi:hypothetical protein
MNEPGAFLSDGTKIIPCQLHPFYDQPEVGGPLTTEGMQQMPIIGTIGPMTGKSEMNDLIEPIARAIATALGDAGQNQADYDPVVRAALEAIEAAGYVVVPREQIEAWLSPVSGKP